MQATKPILKNILLIEDNYSVRLSLAEQLEREGYIVRTAANGQLALDYLHNQVRPDLILLDMLMPVLDGWGFLQEIQRCSPAVTAPVVITTGGAGGGIWGTGPNDVYAVGAVGAILHSNGDEKFA